MDDDEEYKQRVRDGVDKLNAMDTMLTWIVIGAIIAICYVIWEIRHGVAPW